MELIKSLKRGKSEKQPLFPQGESQQEDYGEGGKFQKINSTFNFCLFHHARQVVSVKIEELTDESNSIHDLKLS